MKSRLGRVVGMNILVIALTACILLLAMLHTAISWSLREERDSYKALAHAERQRYDEVVGKAGAALATCVVKP